MFQVLCAIYANTLVTFSKFVDRNDRYGATIVRIAQRYGSKTKGQCDVAQGMCVEPLRVALSVCTRMIHIEH